MRMAIFPRATLLTVLAALALQAQAPRQTPGQFDPRTRWWREARFGMFIHWGIYAVPADATDLEGKKRIAEWYLSNKKMQVKDYEQFASQFNPVKFDARQWVETAKATGMKYIVITSKHHDGFCMFDTKLTDYCITKATPFKRDPMRELAAECRRQGLKLCFYHSIMDWHHPDYLPRRPWDTRPVDGASLDRYLEYMKGQLRELLTNYGPIGVLWFDGGWEHNAQELHSREVNAMIRSLQPSILINNRNRLPADFMTPEQFIPAQGPPPGRLWETCMTINDTWGYAKNDTNWKPAEVLIRNLIDAASKGGNFLLNVGPTAEGEFPEAIHERLARIGAWMKANGESIYGTDRSTFRTLPFEGRVTAKGDRLYLHVFEWPESELKLAGLRTHVLSARALANGERLRVRTVASAEPGRPADLLISKPTKIDPAATVVELSLAGSPSVAGSVPVTKPEADGSFLLKASDAEIHGSTALYEVSGLTDYIGSWEAREDYVTWRLEVPAPAAVTAPPGASAGRYSVEVNYSCEPEDEGSSFTVGVANGAKLSGVVRSAGSWHNFRNESLGEIELPGGKQVVEVRITQMPHESAMNLHQVRLTPAH
jgi:alpha-L-fucosidase